MICYRDMTFCSGDGCRKFHECPRALTDDVKAAANDAGLYVAQFSEPRSLSCYEAPERSIDQAYAAKCAGRSYGND